MTDWTQHPIIMREDGSYLITKCGVPYHVPDQGEWTTLHAQISAYAKEHPDRVQPELIAEPTDEEQRAILKNDFTWLVQRRLDNFARTRTYDSMLSACSYAASTQEDFAVEGRYCVQARDATWKAANAILNDVLDGERPIPEWAEVEVELPVLAWPEGARPQ